MRIAFIGQKGLPAGSGGVERHIEELASRLAQSGQEVFVYARNHYAFRKRTMYKGVHLIYLPSIPTKHLDTITHTFLATLHGLFSSYDVIHYQSIGPSSLAWIIRLFRRHTLIVSTFHCKDYEHQKWGAFARFCLRMAEYITCTVPDATIVVNKGLAHYVKQVYARHSVVIPNGSGAHYVRSRKALKQWRLRAKRYILLVNRLVNHKGVHFAIQAFRLIESEGRVPRDMKLVIVGSGSFTDDYIDSLKQLAKGSSRIVFTGEKRGKMLEQLFSHAYAFLQPSTSEGLSIALLEAMGYGLCSLVSDIKENKETIGKTGLTFRSKDIASLASQLEYLFNNPALATTLGEAAKARARKFFNWDSVAKETLALYDGLLLQSQSIALENIFRSKNL